MTVGVERLPGMHVPLERAGALVVRVWLEGQGVGGLRARITYTVDVAKPGAELTAASSVDEVCEKVRAWLGLFLADASGQASAHG